MVVRGKVGRPLPSFIFYIKQESSLKHLGVYFHSGPTNWYQQFDNLLSKAGRRMHILRVCKKYGYSLDYLYYLFHSLIISLLLMAFQYGVLLPVISIFLELISSRKEQFDLASLRKLRLKRAFWKPQIGNYGKLSPAPPKSRWQTSYQPVKLGHLGIEVIRKYSHRLELNVLTLGRTNKHSNLLLPVKKPRT